MLKRSVTYENFDGKTVTEEFYFNLSKAELIELEVSYKDGLAETLQRIIEAKDYNRLVAEFKKLLLLSYGEKSEDGRRFVKSDQLREEFSQTAAYNQLFVELALDDDKAAEFINGVVPKDISKQMPKTELVPTNVFNPPPPPDV